MARRRVPGPPGISAPGPGAPTPPPASGNGAPRSGHVVAIVAAAWPLLACFAALLALDRAGFVPAPGAPGASIPFLAVLLLAFGTLWWGLRRLRAARRADGEVPAAGILAVAVLLRLLALPLTPGLSDDVYRYLWDGRVAASGANPYLLTPDDESLAGLRDELWRKTAHRDVATVYPPLALGAFTAAAVLPRPLFAYKLGLAGVDLAGCALLLALARRRGNALAALACVWNPLLVVEGAGMGHVDVLGASLAVGCVWLLGCRWRRRGGRPGGRPESQAASGGSRRGRRGTRWVVAGVVAALAVLAKLVPLAALPLWWRSVRGRGQRLFAVGAAALLLPAAAAVLLWTRGVPSGLVEYALRWEYNGPLYEPLWRLIGALQLDLAASGVVHVVRVLFGGEVEATPWSTFYSFAHPRFLARAALLAAAAAAFVRLWQRRPDALHAAFGAFGLVLLASPTFYPWYLIWILPWAALLGARAVLLLSATLPLAYLPALAGVPYFPWVYAAVWLPPLCLFLIDRRRA